MNGYGAETEKREISLYEWTDTELRRRRERLVCNEWTDTTDGGGLSMMKMGERRREIVCNEWTDTEAETEKREISL